MFRAELLKLKRSSLWLVAGVLPLLAVITGSVNFYGNQAVLTSGFDSLSSQVTIFYSLLFFSIGIACLASAAWRMEHKGTNWNLLLTTNDQILRLVLAKTGAILLGVLGMQVVLVTLTYVSGAFILGATGDLPITFLIVALFATFTALPLITVQSLLSMLFKSFGAPVALCLVGCIPAIGLAMNASTQGLARLAPHGINIQALQIGSTASTLAGSFDLATIFPLIVATLVHSAVYIGLTVLAVRKIKLR